MQRRTSLNLHKRFFRFPSPSVSIFDKNFAFNSTFQFRYILPYLHLFFSSLLFNLVNILRSWTLQKQTFLVWRFSIVFPDSSHFEYFTFSPDILFQEFDPMIYKSFSGVENIIPYPIHTDLVVGCPLRR